MRMLIQNGRVVLPVTGGVVLQDLLIEDGKIVLMERGIQAMADQVIQASGLVVCPGLVDMHAHLFDPGFPQREDILSGAAAAARQRNPPSMVEMAVFIFVTGSAGFRCGRSPWKSPSP